jgi:hypothetical protein
MAPILLGLGVFLFSGLSPVNTSFDSRWTVYTAMSLWRHGDMNLDEYLSVIRGNNYYAVECVDAAGHVQTGAVEPCHGHWYDHFPIGGTVLAAPLIFATVETMTILAPALASLHPAQPVVAEFLRANYDLAHPLFEMEVASMFLAATAVVMYFIANRFLPPGKAVLVALLYALATSAYSVGGRALWQHTPSMFLLAITIYLLLRAGERPELAAWAGIPVALSYTVRPTDSLFVLVFTAYVAVHHRPSLLRYLLAAGGVAAIFLTYNFSIYRFPLAPYYQLPLGGFLPRNWGKFAEGLAGNLVSPSRGLFVFTPVFVLSVWSMVRGKWKTPLAPWLAALALLHWLVVSSLIIGWWGGHSYGPRFFTDVTPILVLFLIPYLAGWNEQSRAIRVALITLALAGFAIHLRGGWSQAVFEWNVSPTNIDRHPERNWDWSDPQFLR